MTTKTKIEELVVYDFGNINFQGNGKNNCFDGPAPCDESICDERCDCDCDNSCDSCDCHTYE
jgi:hypothetical protein